MSVWGSQGLPAVSQALASVPAPTAWEPQHRLVTRGPGAGEDPTAWPYARCAAGHPTLLCSPGSGFLPDD